MSDLKETIYAAVRLIPRGKVASYSQIAALAGNCNLRRYVGNALHEKHNITEEDFEVMKAELVNIKQ